MSELQLRTLSKEIHGQLVAELSRAQTWVNTRGYGLDSGTRSGVVTNLKTVQAAIDKLSPNGALTIRLFQGSYSWADWKEHALFLRKMIGDALAVAGAAFPTWGRFWDEVVVPTAKETASGLKEATELGLDLVPWVSAAIVAAVAGYLIFTFRR